MTFEWKLCCLYCFLLLFLLPFVVNKDVHTTRNLAIANRSRVSCMRPQYVEGVYSNSVTLKCRLGVTEGRWKRHYSIDRTRLTISRVIWRWVISWPWHLGETGATWKLGWGFVFAFCSNFGEIWRLIGRKLRICYTPPVFSAPRRWWPRRNLANVFDTHTTRMIGLPCSEEILMIC